MPEPRSLEEWVHDCGRAGHPNSWADKAGGTIQYLALCRDCVSGYAEQEKSSLLADVEQLRVQLAGCLAVAEGWADKGEAVHQGVYGWSPAFEATRTLHAQRDALLAVARAAEQDRSYSPNGLRMIHGGYDHHADTVGTCRMCAALAHPDVQRLMKEVDNAQV